jgi:hypothetical protein
MRKLLLALLTSSALIGTSGSLWAGHYGGMPSGSTGSHASYHPSPSYHTSPSYHPITSYHPSPSHPVSGYVKTTGKEMVHRPTGTTMARIDPSRFLRPGQRSFARDYKGFKYRYYHRGWKRNCYYCGWNRCWYYWSPQCCCYLPTSCWNSCPPGSYGDSDPSPSYPSLPSSDMPPDLPAPPDDGGMS